MKLKCTASIGSVYWQSNEKSAEGFKHKRASYNGQPEYEKRDSYLPGNACLRLQKYGINTGCPLLWIQKYKISCFVFQKEKIE